MLAPASANLDALGSHDAESRGRSMPARLSPLRIDVTGIDLVLSWPLKAFCWLCCAFVRARHARGGNSVAKNAELDDA
jgi:hypothetical protein